MRKIIQENPSQTNGEIVTTITTIDLLQKCFMV